MLDKEIGLLRNCCIAVRRDFAKICCFHDFSGAKIGESSVLCKFTVIKRKELFDVKNLIYPFVYDIINLCSPSMDRKDVND